MSLCRFCNPPDRERILFESSGFYVMLSLGPIVEGYCLIISKQHVSCCADLSDVDLLEFLQLQRRVDAALLQEYGSVIHYEHGRIGSCTQEEGAFTHCYHAHLHCVPANVALDRLVALEYPAVPVDGIDSIRKTIGNDQPYLFVDSGRSCVFTPEGQLASQYLRRTLARAIGHEYLGDWLAFPSWRTIRVAKQRLQRYFAEPL